MKNFFGVWIVAIFSLSVYLTGCGNGQNTASTNVENHTNNVQIVKHNGIPKLRNKELDVELPINVHTDWEVVDHGWAKYVVLYNDPYKQGYPPYKAGKSPDIEQVIYITNFDKDLIPDDDKFEGTWVGGLNERVQGGVVPSEKVDRNKIHTISAFTLRKSPTSGKYEVSIHSYTIPSATEADIQDWQRKGLKDPITMALTYGFPNNNGFDEFNLFFDERRTQTKIENDRLSIELYDGDTKAGHLEMIYHSENDSMEVTKLTFTPDFLRGYSDISDSFGRRGHNEILKRYQYLDVNELMAGLLQMKIDQMKDAHPEFTGYRNLMLDFKHEEIILGSVDLTKQPTMPAMPKGIESDKQDNK